MGRRPWDGPGRGLLCQARSKMNRPFASSPSAPVGETMPQRRGRASRWQTRELIKQKALPVGHIECDSIGDYFDEHFPQRLPPRVWVAINILFHVSVRGVHLVTHFVATPRCSQEASELAKELPVAAKSRIGHHAAIYSLL